MKRMITGKLTLSFNRFQWDDRLREIRVREAFNSPHFLCFDRRVDHENLVLFFSIVIGLPNRFLRKNGK